MELIGIMTRELAQRFVLFTDDGCILLSKFGTQWTLPSEEQLQDLDMIPGAETSSDRPTTRGSSDKPTTGGSSEKDLVSKIQ